MVCIYDIFRVQCVYIYGIVLELHYKNLSLHNITEVFQNVLIQVEQVVMLHYYIQISAQHFCHLESKIVIFFDLVFSVYNSAEYWVKTRLNCYK